MRPNEAAAAPNGADVRPYCTKVPFVAGVGHNSQARLSQDEARRVLARVQGMAAADALWALRFSAGTVCPPIARVVAQAVEQAERAHGVGPAELVMTRSEVGEGETVVRVRRLAHGMADWITTETTDIRVELGLAEGASQCNRT